MQDTLNRSAPTLGVALAYFAVTLWAVPEGYITAGNQTEAVAMGSVIAAHVIMEVKAFRYWVASLFTGKK